MTLDILLNYSPLIAFVAFIGMYSTQIYTTAKTKDVTGIAPYFYVFLTIALAPKLLAQVVSFIKFGTWGLLLAELVNFVPAVIMMILVLRLRRKQGDRNIAKDIRKAKRKAKRKKRGRRSPVQFIGDDPFLIIVRCDKCSRSHCYLSGTSSRMTACRDCGSTHVYITVRKGDDNL